ncbi:hypothetical protein RJ639_001957 [Escallonia herrerae]|uniref:Leucine-rich repeat receptor-like protein kinase n=1 Tax=Escallonia herrerae TaxID=1293975 RepID=A0AA88XBM5_9ASTE|nr:hypothetical protein RJ639_001957 [Escallonia herrerae]
MSFNMNGSHGTAIIQGWTNHSRPASSHGFVERIHPLLQLDRCSLWEKAPASHNNQIEVAGTGWSIVPSYREPEFRELFLYDNGFTGNIPQEICKLSRLSSLALGNNSFLGEILANILQCLNVVELDLGGNNLVGIIPMEFHSLLKLQRLYVHSNNLTGHIPAFLGNFSDLGYIYRLRNNFQGSVPDTLGRLTKLTEIGFAGNKMSGTLPPISNSSSLVLIDFPDNQIGGSLPLDIGLSLPRVKAFNLAGNQFIGNIPVSISNASQLVRLALNRNGFTGRVPNFNKLQNLQWLALSGNQLGNGATDDLTQVFHYRRKSTRGKHPYRDRGLANIERLYLGPNQFSGSIPNSVGNLQKLKLLRLSGNIPSSLGNLTLLISLYLGGSILLGAGDFQKLASLNLSNNMLSGEFLSSLGSCISLTVLSVAGEVPAKGAFWNVSKVLLDGNSKLCGGVTELMLPKCATRNASNRNKVSHALVLIIPISCGVLVLILVLVSVLVYKRRHPKKGRDFKAIVYAYMVSGNLDECSSDSLSHFLDIVFRVVQCTSLWLFLSQKVCDPALLRDEEQDHPELLQDEEQDETRRKNIPATGNQANHEKLKDTLVAIFTNGIACSKQLPIERMDIVDVTNRLHSIRDTLPGSIGRKVTGRLEVI